MKKPSTQLCVCSTMYKISVVFAQQHAAHPPSKRLEHIGSSLSAMTYFAALVSHIPFISPAPFLRSFQRDGLTEHCFIQPEGQVSGRRSLASGSTRVWNTSLQPYFFQSIIMCTLLCIQFPCFLVLH